MNRTERVVKYDGSLEAVVTYDRLKQKVKVMREYEECEARDPRTHVHRRVNMDPDNSLGP